MVREDAPALLRDDLIPRLSDTATLKQLAPLKQGEAKSLFLFNLPSGEEQQCFIIKRYEHKHLADRLKTLVRGCKAVQELEAACGVAQRGIPTPLPLAIGMRKSWRMVRESFVILEKIKGCQDVNRYFLTEYVPCTSAASLSEKWRIIKELGTLARRVNEVGVHQSDFSLNNFLLQRDKQGEIKLYLSDFEKITLRRSLTFKQEITCLAKLNRVGREVSLADRMRFLKFYAGLENGGTQLRALSRTIQNRTRVLLLHDYDRGRKTSVYTDALYEKIVRGTVSGYIRKGYALDDIIAVVNRFDLLAGNLPDREMKDRDETTVEVPFHGSMHRLNAVRFTGRSGTMSAATIWTKTSTLALAGFPVRLPHIFLEVRAKHGEEGYLFYHQREDETSLGSFCTPSRGSREIVAALELLVSLLQKLHQFGVFSDTLSESTFTFREKRGGKPFLYLNSTEPFSLKKDPTLNERKRNLVLLSALIKKYNPALDFDLTGRYFSRPGPMRR